MAGRNPTTASFAEYMNFAQRQEKTPDVVFYYPKEKPAHAGFSLNYLFSPSVPGSFTSASLVLGSSDGVGSLGLLWPAGALCAEAA